MEKGERFGSVEGRTFISNAVVRLVEAGFAGYCAADAKCFDERQRIGFKAKRKLQVIIANVYEDGVWDRTEFYHPECYDTLGQPHDRPYTGEPLRTQQERDMLEHIMNRQNQQTA